MVAKGGIGAGEGHGTSLNGSIWFGYGKKFRMWMLCIPFVDSDTARSWREDIFGACADCNISDKEFALNVGVSFSRISEFKSGENGLDARRLAHMPPCWHTAFIARRAKRHCQRVIEDTQIDKLIATLNLWMVQAMERELRKPRMAKCGLPRVEKKERAS